MAVSTIPYCATACRRLVSLTAAAAEAAAAWLSRATVVATAIVPCSSRRLAAATLSETRAYSRSGSIPPTAAITPFRYSTRRASVKAAGELYASVATKWTSYASVAMVLLLCCAIEELVSFAKV